METYNWGDLTEEEKLDVLHIWIENIDQRLRQFGESVSALHSRLDRVDAKDPRNICS